jgi:MoaA/NifB/PqqE/SkfB family radical SAM enzyme
LDKLLFTGTIGDPCTAPNLIDVIKLIRSKAPNLHIAIATNGGMKSANWWALLANALGPNSLVTFAIDGLEDTNDIYRVNVRWKNVMSNTKAFIDAGGVAAWQYIVFEHNQHQVEQAREEAERLGFKKFTMRPSHRFKVDEMLGVDGRYGRDNIPIKPPTDNQFVHKVMFVNKKEKFDLPKWFEKSNNTHIKCYVKEAGSVYIDYKGRILPCCFLSGGVFVRRDTKYPDGWDDIWNTYGDALVNLHNQSWSDIISGEFFQRIESSWTTSYKEGRLLTCAGTCSEFQGRLNDPEEFVKEQTTLFDPI